MSERDDGNLIYQLEVAATTFETVQSKEYRDSIFNASHAALLRKAIAAMRSQANGCKTMTPNHQRAGDASHD